MNDSAVSASHKAASSRAESEAQSRENSAERNTNYEEGRITVSVRLRPLNSRELKLSAGSCIAALEEYNTLYILPPGESERDVHALLANDPHLRGIRHHRFTFDNVYDANSTQEQVYERIGRPVLQSSFCGYHTCIFAYGQTGSGKSYCMMGADGGCSIDDAPGIVPRLCRELFLEMGKRKQAALEKEEEVDFSVYVSYLEIYRERVRSLLHEVHDAKVVAGGSEGCGPASPRLVSGSVRRSSLLHAADSADAALRVREHPTLGVYVEGLAEIAVTSEEQVLRLMLRGNQRRHMASTRMNETSSRSHAIFTLQLLQKRTRAVPSGKGSPGAVTTGASSSAAATMTTQLGAKINLVDLAGSERAKATGAEGDTLKEGAQINKSLTTLGIVINALAAQSTPTANSPSGASMVRSAAAPKRHIPYRDSTLTFLLKESLGGNSKTFMIATVSPSGDSYDESLSTLRYADRAKAIVTKAFVNETAGDKRIRELEEEVTRLREQIRSLLSAEAQRSSTSTTMAMGPGEPAVSESPPLPSVMKGSHLYATHENWADEGECESCERSGAHSSATDMDATHMHETDEGLQAQSAGLENSLEGSEGTPAPNSPIVKSPVESRAEFVATLESELRRAEEMIRQMSESEAERKEHVAQLVKRHEEEQAAMLATAAAATKGTYNSTAGVRGATIRLCREEPYLLNMDGAGDWVVAHLVPGETRVGVFLSHLSAASDAKAAASPTERESDGEVSSQATSFDSSLVLSSHLVGSDGDANAVVHDDDAGARYLRLPKEFSDGVGGPHCILERLEAAGTAVTATSTTVLRACTGYETFVMRPMCRRPFVVRGSDSLVLQSGDVLDIGDDHIHLKYMDPAAPPVTSRGLQTARMETEMYGGDGDQSADGAKSDRGTGSATGSGASSANTQEQALKSLQRLTPTFDRRSDGVGVDAKARARGGTPGDGDEREDSRADAASSFEVDSSQWTYNQGDEPVSFSAEQGYPEEGTHERRGAGGVGTGAALAAPQSLSRPLIPTLALGKALPGSRLSTPPLQQYHSVLGDPLDTVSADAAETESSTTFSDSAGLSAASPLLKEIANAPSLSLPIERLQSAAGTPIAQTRASSKRAPQTTHLNPDTALPLSYLQSMRTYPSKSTYRSETAPRFVGRYNFVFVGPSGSGKTSLVRNLQTRDTPWLHSAFSAFMSNSRVPTGVDAGSNSWPSGAVHPTIGIQTTTLIAAGATPMRLHVHELGGMPYFSPLLDQLPAHRVTYLLCFPLHGGPSFMSLRGIVEDILCRTDSHTVSLVLVATHAHHRSAADGKDGSGGLFSRRLTAAQQAMLQAQMEELELQVVSLIQMLQPYPQLRPTVVGRFAVDNVHRQVYSTGYRAVEGFPEWLEWLGDLARDRCRADTDFASGLVPVRCLELGRQVGLLRERGKWCLSLRDFKALATAVSAQYDAAEAADPSLARDTLRHHVQLLADWGVLAHRFRSTPLRQHVILDVRWLCRALTTLACCALVAEAESDGLDSENDAQAEATAGKQRPEITTRKELVLRILLTPEAEGVIDVVKVAAMDTAHLLRYGVLTLPVLATMLEPHFRAFDSAGVTGSGSSDTGVDVGRGKAGVRKADSIGVAGFDSPATNARYTVPLAGIIELFVLCDLLIVGHKLFFSPSPDASPTAAAPAQGVEVEAGALPVSAAPQRQRGRVHEGDGHNPDDIEPEEESFVLYPLSCRTPASAGVTWLFPCFLSGPFYIFKLDMVPRNFFPKLMCRLATVSSKVYLGPVQPQRWGRPTQQWAAEATRGRVTAAGCSSAAAARGPFDSYFADCVGKSFVLPRFSTYLTRTSAEGSPRRWDGLWFDTAWLLYKDREESDDCEDDNCRVLVRLVHHSVFLSFHCDQAASSSGMSGSGASPGVQDFYEAVLEAVRHVVEEFPGSKCSESMQCSVDPVTLLEMELKHPAIQSDQEASALNRYVRYMRINDNLNSLERVLAKNGTALRTARTARRSHAPGSQDVGDESAYVPLLRNFSATRPLDIAECLRIWKTKHRFFISAETEAQLMDALQELDACYRVSPPLTAKSCFALDRLLDVLARIDTA
ncbi:hypothetical protein LSCM1_02763 [Leishmania martiniquensis]|uniref:Kinesin motor domain-containing protein n=1 Tax=Leishmania martiniquensis TaxID=1580590 RepID=A0A836H344_9TRYP|nr:hypothetical protein LSCM1_02763 [Leishmania martiniquensis]